MISLKEFSNIAKDILSNNISDMTYAFINHLPIGITNYNFGFILEGKSVKILSPLESLSVAFETANIIKPQQDYTLSIRILSQGATKTISKSAHSKIKVERLKEEILTGAAANRIFYEIITTEDFEITHSEYEGTVVRFKNEDAARRFIQLLVGLFPFAEFKRDDTKAKIFCTFDIQKYDGLKKGIEKKGRFTCKISINDKIIGTKSSSFIL